MLLEGHTSFSRDSFHGAIRHTILFRRTTYISAALLSLITLAILCPIYLIPDNIEATSKPAQPASLNYSATSSTASVAFDVSSTSGTFASSSTSGTNAEFSISTDNATGYVLTLRTSGSDTALKDTTNSSNTISNITSTSGITASSFSANTWGILPSKYNSTANTGNNPNYYKIDSTGFTMDETSSANSTANTYTVGLGLKVDFTKSAGTYTNTTVIAEYVAKPITYAIYYYTNTQDTVTGMPVNNPQVPVSSFPGTTSTTTNLASAPSRDGYNFLGWCAGTSSASNITVGTNGAADTCSSTTYDAGQSFGINATGSGTDTYYLYAMWQEAMYTITFTTSNADSIVFNGVTYTNGQTTQVRAGTYHIYGKYATKYAWQSWSVTAGTIGNSSYQNTTYTVSGNATITLTGQSVVLAMQDVDYTTCTTTARPVYDNRDNTVYWIQKLTDGKCWLLDNLSFDMATNVNVITTTNTHVNSDGINALKNGGTSPYSAAVASNIWNSNLDNSYTNAVINISNEGITLKPSGTTNYTNSVTGAYGLGQNKIGVYYNYCAASGGTYCYAQSAGTGNASYDICPAGWRLPTSNSTGEYQNVAISITGVDTSPYSNSQADSILSSLSTPLSGAFVNGEARDQGSLGFSVSSTRRVNYDMYGLYITHTDVYAYSSSYGRYYGYSVRCLLDPTVVITVDSNVANITLKEGSTSGTTITGTKSGNTITFKNVKQGTNYYLYPTFNSGYEFSSWAKTDSASGSTLSSTSTENAYYTVGNSDGSLTLTSKQSKIWFQNATSAQCGQTMYDNRGTDTYKNIAYSTASINGLCWMTRNLDLPGGTTITSSDSNVSSSYTLPSSSTYPVFDDTNYYSVYNTGSTTCTSSSGCYSYYSYNVASARDSSSDDICPKGWRLPTESEYTTLRNTYTTGTTLTASPWLGVYSGSIGNGFESVGSQGTYWVAGRTYYLAFTSSNVGLYGSYYRYIGRAVRCVAKS